MKYIFLFLLVSLSFTEGISQGLEENESVLLMKANVLFESGRYDEAVRMYNRILAMNDNYSAALLMRAKAKYELGAFQGTKNDALRYYEKSGVNKDIIRLMASTELKLKNLGAANNYVLTAIELDPYDAEMYLLAGDISTAANLLNDACERYATAAQLGNYRAGELLKLRCHGYVREPRTIKTDDPTDKEAPKDSVANENDVTVAPQIDVPIEDPNDRREEVNIPDINERTERPAPVDLDATQEIEVDETLHLIITNGLGKRNIEEVPNIFMLADESGHVVVDLCVDQDGTVISTTFNRDRSTLYRSSLTSLALRKAKEFIFLPSLRPQQCGSIIFRVKA